MTVLSEYVIPGLSHTYSHAFFDFCHHCHPSLVTSRFPGGSLSLYSWTLSTFIIFFLRVSYSSNSLTVSFPFELNTYIFKIYFSHALSFYPSWFSCAQILTAIRVTGGWEQALGINFFKNADSLATPGNSASIGYGIWNKHARKSWCWWKVEHFQKCLLSLFRLRCPLNPWSFCTMTLKKVHYSYSNLSLF